MSSKKPGELQTIAILQLVTGILGVMMHAGMTLSLCGLWLILLTPIYGIVASVMAIVSGAKGLGTNDRHNLYKTVAIMQIISILAFDLFGMISGIVSLVLLGNENVQQYLATGPDGAAVPDPAEFESGGKWDEAKEKE